MPVTVTATDAAKELESIIGMDELEDALDHEQRKLLEEMDNTGADGFLQTLQQMFSESILQSSGYFHRAGRIAAAILAVCLVCGICTTAESAAARAVILAGALGIAGISITDIGSLFTTGSAAIQELASFSHLFFPVMSAAAISSGALTSAPMIYSITVLFTDLLLTCITKLLLPTLYVLLGLAFADCAIGEEVLGRLRSLISGMIRASLKLILYVFTAFLTITQVISGTTDVMTAKAAKLTISSVVPVVGSIISDASETVLASASVLKSSVGIFGMCAVISIVILPFLQIGIHYLAMKLTGAIASVMTHKRLLSMIDGISEALGLMLAMTGTCALMQLISAACSLRAVGY